MSDHQEIRSLLALHVAGGLSREEQTAVRQHLGECRSCREELADLSAIADSLKSMPPPQLSFGLAQRTRARIVAEIAAREERRQQQRYLTVMIGFAWLVTVLTFVIGRFVVADVAAWLRISRDTCMTAFISYMIFSATASIAFAGVVATRHRNERRLI
jgi:anti-sigma factor RsiW